MKRLVAILAAVLIVAAAALYAFRSRGDREKIELSGTVETRAIQVGSKVGGRISEVLVEEGQNVKKDDPLVRFEAGELRAERDRWAAHLSQAEAVVTRFRNGYRAEEIAQADANLRRERANLEALREGPRKQEIAQVEAELKAAEADAANAETSFKRMEKLYAAGDISAQSRDDTRARRDLLAARAEAVRQRLALLLAGTRDEEIRAAEERVRQAEANARMMRSGYRAEDVAEATARVAEARAQLENATVRLAEMEVKAPADARVEVVSVRPGDLVQPGRAVVTLLEPSQLWVRVYIPEPDLGRVSVGQKAAVYVDTFPNRDFSGTIEQIASQAEFLPRNIQTRDDRNKQVFGVKIRVENREGVLKSGMAAHVRIDGK